MKTLAFETSQAACSVAVRIDGRLAARRAIAADKGHAELLLPLAAAALAEAGVHYDDLDLLGVTVGPGLFTGVRVGLAAVRGLRLVLGIPAVGVGTLEALAAGARASGAVRANQSITVVNDARREEVYVQTFSAAAQSTGDVQLLSVAAAAAGIAANSIVIGTGAALIATHTPVRVAAGNEQADAAIVAMLAEQVAQAADFADRGPPRPLYVRAPHVIRKNM